MRLLLAILAGIVAVAAIVIFAAPYVISTESVRKQLFTQVEAATGYRLRVDGPVQFSLFPSLHLVASDVGIAEGASGAPELAKAKTLRFGLVWSALWGGKIEITELGLVDPVIAVPASAPQSSPKAGPAIQGAEPSSSSPVETLRRLSLGKLTIENGTIVLPPSGGASGKRIEALDLDASLPSGDAPLKLDASAKVDGKELRVGGTLASLGNFLNGDPTPLSLAVEAPDYLGDKATLQAVATYRDGALALSKVGATAGDKTLTTAALLYQQGALTVSEFNAQIGDKAVAGNASYKNSLLTVSPLTVKAPGNALSGSLAADLSGKVPAFNAALTAKTLDLDALLGQSGGSAPGARPGNSAPPAAGNSPGGGDWSDAKIDFSPLKLANGKLKLTAETLLYNKAKISPVTLDATLANGKLSAQLPGLKLYNGSGAASVAIDASGPTPAQAIKLNLTNFDAYPLLKDAANFESIEGTGTIALDLTASGASQRAIVSALNGTAKLDFANGAVRGVNIAKMIRNVSTNVLSGWQQRSEEKTDFASLGASFKIAQGVAETSDLHLIGPLVRMTGSGSASLPAKSLNLRVEPQLVASLEGQGGKTDLQGLKVPVMVTGPWARPKIYPDIAGILQDPQAAYEQLKQLGGGLGSLPAGALPGNIVKNGKIDKDALKQGLGQLLGKQKSPAAPASTDSNQAGDEAMSEADPEPAAQPAPTPKQKKKDAAKQMLQNFMGGGGQ